ncbi:PDR/VanB family oxidoreductase [Cupriavidus metallidurans]|nr:PDR/VanB family oxidoreductase [Cupriavidus metallidurans]
MNTSQIELRLKRITFEAERISSFEFVSADANPLPGFQPGAHIDLHLQQGMIRSYSLANAASADPLYYRVAVQREPNGRGGSRWAHDKLRVGDKVWATPPQNDFPLDECASSTVFFVGGIGITPVLPMLRRLDAIGREWKLMYASRSPGETAFAEELQRIDAGRGRIVHFHDSEPGQRLEIRATVAALPASTHVYCCGPTGMIDDFLAVTAERDPSTVHYERFGAAQQAATEGGFDVVLHRSGAKYRVEPGKTILDVLLDNNVAVPYSCCNGVCGSCRTEIIDGQADHRDDFLSDEEKQANQAIMVCCSGARSKTLVLDL